MREGDCSAYDSVNHKCKNGFPVSGVCFGKIGPDPHCVREKWLDNPKKSAWCLDESGKPKGLVNQQPAWQE